MRKQAPHRQPDRECVCAPLKCVCVSLAAFFLFHLLFFEVAGRRWLVAVCDADVFCSFFVFKGIIGRIIARHLSDNADNAHVKRCRAFHTNERGGICTSKFFERKHATGNWSRMRNCAKKIIFHESHNKYIYETARAHGRYHET